MDRLTEYLTMKTKKSAAIAALKLNDIKSTSSAPKPPASGVNPAASAAKPAASAVNPAASAARPASGALTTIDVKIDVGFGNAVYLRGQGPGLTWERGVPLACVDGRTWRWSQAVANPITFKVLLNDKVWSAGNDLVVKPGQKLEVSPSFA
jgi:hypothetical protein